MKILNYKKSFLLFWHIILGLLLSLFTLIVGSAYLREQKPLGMISAIFILLLYIVILYHTSQLFNKNRVGVAYFLTISGFLVSLFVQFITCATLVPFRIH